MDPAPPTVSVVIPAFNSRRFILRCLESVADQTLPGVETIVVDDASTDGTRDVVANAAVRGLRCIGHETNRGSAAARNTGLAEARAPYVAFLDADDAMKPDNLMRKVEVLERHREVALVHSGAEGMDEDGAPFFPSDGDDAPAQPRLERLFPRILYGNAITLSSVVARREPLEAAGGFDTGLRFAEDWDLWIRLAHDHAFAYIPEPLIWYRIHPGGKSRPDRDRLRARAQALEEIIQNAFRAYPLEAEGLSSREVYWANYFRVLKNQADSLPPRDVVALYGQGVRSHPRALLWSAGAKVPLKLVARALLPRRVLEQRRFRRQAARLRHG